MSEIGALTEGKPRVAVSSCLLGQNVRYDGGHKFNAGIVDELGADIEFVAFCPEVAAGLGIPRPPVQLLRQPDGLHAVGVEPPHVDVTAALSDYAMAVVSQLADVSGYIFKCRSPSCAVSDAPVRNGSSEVVGYSAGIYAGILMQHLPALPVSDEQRLQDARLREGFIRRVQIMHAWQTYCRQELTQGRLLAFHSHITDQGKIGTPLEQWLAELAGPAEAVIPDAAAQRYISLVMQALG